MTSPAAGEYGESVASAVGVVVVVERVVPPGAIFFLLGNHQRGELLRPPGLLLFGEQKDTLRGVVVPIEIEVT